MQDDDDDDDDDVDDDEDVDGVPYPFWLSGKPSHTVLSYFTPAPCLRTHEK